MRKKVNLFLLCGDSGSFSFEFCRWGFSRVKSSELMELVERLKKEGKNSKSLTKFGKLTKFGESTKIGELTKIGTLSLTASTSSSHLD